MQGNKDQPGIIPRAVEVSRATRARPSFLMIMQGHIREDGISALPIVYPNLVHGDLQGRGVRSLGRQGHGELRSPPLVVPWYQRSSRLPNFPSERTSSVKSSWPTSPSFQSTHFKTSISCSRQCVLLASPFLSLTPYSSVEAPTSNVPSAQPTSTPCLPVRMPSSPCMSPSSIPYTT